MSSGELKRVFITVLEQPPDADFDGLALHDTPRWDSMAHIELISGIEQQFGIVLEPEEILEMTSFQKTVEILGKRGLLGDD